MKRKNWTLVGFLILAMSFVDISCPLFVTRKTSTPMPDPWRIYSMEYDCQISYDILTQGWYKADSVFSAAKTNLSIHWSESGLESQEVYYDSVQYYIWPHMEKINPGPSQQIRYKSYMMAMQDAYGKPVTPGFTIIGWQTGSGGGYTMCVVFVQAIRDNYFPPDDKIMEIKTAIHEMGHMRADLSDLCDDYGGVNPDHDDLSCVMGWAKICPCTGQDVATNPHFCQMCIDKLKKVFW
jgi:hypothetical protein